MCGFPEKELVGPRVSYSPVGHGSQKKCRPKFKYYTIPYLSNSAVLINIFFLKLPLNIFIPITCLFCYSWSRCLSGLVHSSQNPGSWDVKILKVSFSSVLIEKLI